MNFSYDSGHIDKSESRIMIFFKMETMLAVLSLAQIVIGEN